ncbi:AraC family transcriptional regulator [Cohnella herbarum]|uniref:AraC family transcriptional regulator n=1 Tax=Cohnella herbarum TaxID=2728023 RepID=A0A7Z2ZMA0_9BACL|nr:AraC family transcriptional regulator [Cohnella herbarum]QJD84635.1 AraC family transcriptional regulator [Cohnella herbarum]
MSRERKSLIERIELKGNFFLHYRVKHGNSYFFHAHQGIEFLYVHQGNGHALVNDQLVKMEPGTLLLFQPFQLHQIHMESGSDYIRTVLVFDPTLIDKQLAQFKSLQLFFRWLWHNEIPMQHFPFGEQSGEMERLLEVYHMALQTDVQELRTEEIGLCMIALLQLLRRSFFSKQDVSAFASQPRTLRYAEKVMQWVESHYQEQFDLSKLSDHLFVSPSHISRLFHKETGATISDYVTARRLREACLLLAATQLSVREIAHKVGLLSGPYFGRLFKKQFDVTPLQYRNRMRSLSR